MYIMCFYRCTCIHICIYMYNLFLFICMNIHLMFLYYLNVHLLMYLHTILCRRGMTGLYICVIFQCFHRVMSSVRTGLQTGTKSIESHHSRARYVNFVKTAQKSIRTRRTSKIHLNRDKERGGGLGSRPKKMYGERLGDGVEYHLIKPTPRR